MLLEIMLAVAIFALGVLALGQCMTNCLQAQSIREQEDRARQALENRMAELQASPTLPDENHQSQLKGMFTGITLFEHRRTLDVKNEDNVALPNLHEVSITARWTATGGTQQARTVEFTLLRGNG